MSTPAGRGRGKLAPKHPPHGGILGHFHAVLHGRLGAVHVHHCNRGVAGGPFKLREDTWTPGRVLGHGNAKQGLQQGRGGGQGWLRSAHPQR